MSLRRTSDPALRDALIEDHLWLARHCARRFAGRGESPDDLLQVANLALVNAVDRFDPTFRVRFATFAVPTIVGELRRHFRDRTWSVRVSRRLKDLHLELQGGQRAPGPRARSPRHRRRAGRRARLHRRRTSSRRSRPAPPTGRRASAPASAPTRTRRSSPAQDDDELVDTSVRVVVQKALNTLPGARAPGRLPALLPRPHPERDRRGDRREPGARVPDPAIHPVPAGRGAGRGRRRAPRTRRVASRCPIMSHPRTRPNGGPDVTPQGFAVEVSDPDDGRVRVEVRGELDMAAAPDLAEAHRQGLAAAAPPWCSTSPPSRSSTRPPSAPWWRPAATSGEAGGRLQIGPRSDIVNRVLEITGLARAVRSLRRPAEGG